MKETFTTFEISQFCNVFMTTVANWIDNGKLAAYRTPGGHRRVKRRDLLDFLTKYGMPVPEELLEKTERKVLIVDDNLEMLEMLERLFARNPNLVVRSAHDGFEAGKQVVVFRPDVLIIDVVLPGLDGLQVCRDMKSDPITRDIRIVVTTGHSDPLTRQEFEKLGVDLYLEKPLDLEPLLRQVEALAATAASRPLKAV
jgi:excisionase family DNA binding protein